MNKDLYKVKEFKILAPTTPKVKIFVDPEVTYSIPIKHNSIKEANFVKGIDHSNISTPNKISLNSSTDSKFESFSSSLDETTKVNYVDQSFESNSPVMTEAMDAITDQLKTLTSIVKDLQKSATPSPVQKLPLCKKFTEIEDVKAYRELSKTLPTDFEGGSGSDVQDHIRKFETWCLFAQVLDDESRVKWFYLTLAKQAVIWFNHTDFFSYADLVSKFQENFGEFRSVIEARTAFYAITLKSGERAIDYHRRLWHVGRLANMSEVDVSDQFYRGLTKTHNCVKQIRSLYTIDQALVYLQSILDLEEEKPAVTFSSLSNSENTRQSRSNSKNRSNSKDSKGNSKNRNSNSRGRSNSKKRSRSGSKHRNSNSRTRSNSSNKRPATPHSNNSCHNCGGRGHFANNCTSPNYRTNSNKNRSSEKGNRYYAIQSEDDTGSCESESSINPSLMSSSVLYRKVTDIHGNSVIIPVEDRNVSLN